jgi:PhzF family phenazine biosynthesis protein
MWAALTTVLLWASAFVGIRAAGQDLSAGALTLGRLLVGSAALGAVAWRQRPPLPPRADLPRLLLIGVLWFGVYNVALNEGERHVDAGTAAMLVNVGPVLIAVLAGVVLKEGFPRTLLAGCAIAFAGAILIGIATSDGGLTPNAGAALCLLAALTYAIAVVAQKPLLARASPLSVTWLACVIGAACCLPFAPTLVREAGDASAESLAWTAYLGLFPTALAFTTWAYALQHTSAGRMGATTYLVPPLATLFGWAYFGETPPGLALAGGALCLGGAALARRSGLRSAAMPEPEILRLAAFTDDPAGGNPAGVVLDASGLDAEAMQAIAAEVGYSETAFVDGDRVRYFSPAIEVPFCGHATIATAVALAQRDGPGARVLRTAAGDVAVATQREAGGAVTATLTSVPPRVEDAPDLAVALAALGWDAERDLDPTLPPRVAFAGARHLVLAARTRERLADLDYGFDALKAYMSQHDLTTVALVWREDATTFHARNPFPVGGVVEDPATGAAAAAFGAYLRALGLVEPPVRLTIHQGDDMGRPSLLLVDLEADPDSGVRVTGGAVAIA